MLGKWLSEIWHWKDWMKTPNTKATTTAATNPVYTWDITYGVPKLKRIHGVTVVFNANHKENYGSQELAAKELSNWFGKHVSRRTIYRALKEKNGNLTVGDRTVIVKYMED